MPRSHQVIKLPVLPSTKRRQAVGRPTAPLALIYGDARLLPTRPSRGRAPASRYRYAGVYALCLTSVGLVAALVIFSIVRDQKALLRPPAPIAAPLQP